MSPPAGAARDQLVTLLQDQLAGLQHRLVVVARVPPSMTLPEQRANGEGMYTDDTDEDDDVFTDYHYDSEEKFDDAVQILRGVATLVRRTVSVLIANRQRSHDEQ